MRRRRWHLGSWKDGRRPDELIWKGMIPILRGTGAIVKRLSIMLLALAVVFGMTTQVVRHASAMMAMSSMGGTPATTSDAGDASNDEPAPCKGLTPACIDAMGCVMALGVPLPALSVSATIRWTSVAYLLATDRLSGSSVEPELFPPIFVA